MILYINLKTDECEEEEEEEEKYLIMESMALNMYNQRYRHMDINYKLNTKSVFLAIPLSTTKMLWNKNNNSPKKKKK